MPYIGRGTDKLSNVEVLDNITFDGSSSYTLQKGGSNFTPSSANTLLVSIDGVVQAGNFTVSGSTIDFGTAVAGTSTCDFILHYGTGLITTPADGTVTTAKLGDSAVSTAKLATDAVTEAKIADGAVESEHLNNNIISGQTELATAPDDTDEFLVSDAGTLKRIDYTHIKGLADTNQAIVKGWVNFSGSGTVSINQSYNCTSVTDNGTGSYAVNWSGGSGATGSNHATAGGGDLGGYNNNERVQVYNAGNNQTGVESWNGTTATDFSPLHCLTFGNGS